MVDSVSSLITRVHGLLVELMTQGPQSPGLAEAFQDAAARAGAVGPEGAWLAAGAHVTLGGLAVARGERDPAIRHLDAAVTAGYNDCVALHIGLVQPLHHDPRFQALYRRIRVTEADLEEFFWLHREMQTTAREAQDLAVDNIGRLDTGVSVLPQAPVPTHEPHTPGVLATRLELAATQTAVQRSVMKTEFQRSAGNTSLDLIDGTWDHHRAMRDAWDADEQETRRRLAAAARAFVPRPRAGSTLVPAPPLGSIRYPA